MPEEKTASTYTAGVYFHIRPKSRKIFYIGYTGNIDGKRPDDERHRNPYWNNTVKKYGKEVVIFSRGGVAEMLELEKTLIKVIGQENLVNMTEGGEGSCGYPMTFKHRDKISKANKGKTPWNKGIPLTDETKKKLSDSLKGRKVWNKGIPMTNKMKAILIKANTGIKRSPEWCLRQSIQKKGKTFPYKEKPFKYIEVSQFLKNGELVETFAAIKKAVFKTSIGRTNIMNVLAGRAKTAGGYVWKYTNLLKTK